MQLCTSLWQSNNYYLCLYEYKGHHPLLKTESSSRFSFKAHSGLQKQHVAITNT